MHIRDGGCLKLPNIVVRVYFAFTISVYDIIGSPEYITMSMDLSSMFIVNYSMRDRRTKASGASEFLSFGFGCGFLCFDSRL